MQDEKSKNTIRFGSSSHRRTTRGLENVPNHNHSSGFDSETFRNRRQQQQQRRQRRLQRRLQRRGGGGQQQREQRRSASTGRGSARGTRTTARGDQISGIFRWVGIMSFLLPSYTRGQRRVTATATVSHMFRFYAIAFICLPALSLLTSYPTENLGVQASFLAPNSCNKIPVPSRNIRSGMSHYHLSGMNHDFVLQQPSALFSASPSSRGRSAAAAWSNSSFIPVEAKRRIVTSKPQKRDERQWQQKNGAANPIPYGTAKVSTRVLTRNNFKDSSTNKQTQQHLKETKAHVIYCLEQNDYSAAHRHVEKVISSLVTTRTISGENKTCLDNNIVSMVDEMVQLFTSSAFELAMLSSSFSSSGEELTISESKHRVSLAMNLVQIQLSSQDVLPHPYSLVPKRTFINALKALTNLSVRISEAREQNDSEKQTKYNSFAAAPTDLSSAASCAAAAYRVLQRLLTGVGVRTRAKQFVADEDFNRVLNAFVMLQEYDHVKAGAGRVNGCNYNMQVAQRIVSLQERVPHAPPLSPVTYSILLKGYGRCCASCDSSSNNNLDDNSPIQLQQKETEKRIERVLHHAYQNAVRPDIVMINSYLDALINCNSVPSANSLFLELKRLSRGPTTAASTIASNQLALMLFANSVHPLPRPNTRTYNTILKGLAKQCGSVVSSGSSSLSSATASAIAARRVSALEEAKSLALEMEARGLWDPITTNTLVHAAVEAKDFVLATRILDQHTISLVNGNENPNPHPNVEAYTKLLDGYSKDEKLDKALGVLQVMRQKGVEPNEITYTCLIAGFGRSKKLLEARKMLAFMEKSGIRPSCVTYNAFLSGIVTPSTLEFQEEAEYSVRTSDRGNYLQPVEEVPHVYMDEGLRVLRQMLQSGIRPNDVTISTLIRALGQCHVPRVSEAKMLLERLEREKLVDLSSSSVIATAMIQTCARARDLKTALEAFRKVRKPDVVVINAFLDICCRCGRTAFARDTFEFYFRNKRKELNLRPDVVTFSILISSLLRKGTVESIEDTQKLYNEMRTREGLLPDKALVDIMLKSVIRVGQTINLPLARVKFVARILLDAEKLTSWEENQLERRKRAVRAVFADKLRGMWRNNAAFNQLMSKEDDDDDDELFRRKGWNKVDSRFRILGSSAGDFAKQFGEKEKVVDKFLESKGWNDVDSGFRII